MSVEGPKECTELDFMLIPEKELIDEWVSALESAGPLFEVYPVQEPLPLNQIEIAKPAAPSVLPLEVNKPETPSRTRIKPSAPVKQRVKPAAKSATLVVQEKTATLIPALQPLADKATVEPAAPAKAPKASAKVQDTAEMGVLPCMELLAVKESAALDAKQDVGRNIVHLAGHLKKEAKAKFGKYAALYLGLYNQFYQSALEIKKALEDEKKLTIRKTKAERTPLSRKKLLPTSAKQSAQKDKPAASDPNTPKGKKSLNERIRAIKRQSSPCLKLSLRLQSGEKTLENKVALLEKRVAGVLAESVSFKEDKEGLAGKIDTLQKYISRVSEESVSFKKDRAGLQSKIKTLEKKITDVLDHNATFKEDNAALKKEIVKLKRELETLNNKSKQNPSLPAASTNGHSYFTPTPIASSKASVPVSGKKTPASQAAKKSIVVKPIPPSQKPVAKQAPAPLKAKPAPKSAKQTASTIIRAQDTLGEQRAISGLIALTAPVVKPAAVAVPINDKTVTSQTNAAITPALKLQQEKQAMLAALAKRKKANESTTPTPGI